jgi:SpoVK/Ycf46/Vps4 family AAA+-type ATPase
MQESFLIEIDQNTIMKKIEFFFGFENTISRYKAIADKIFKRTDDNEIAILSAFGFGSKILMYGEPGVGKTSIAFRIASYILDEFGVSAYSLSVPSIIKSNLGETTSNMKESLDDIREIAKETGIVLVLDEIDRLSVVRNSESELAEMKRALLELNDFLDNISIRDKIFIMGITNHFEILDSGLKRRFDFVDKIIPEEKSLLTIIKNLNKLIGIDVKSILELQKILKEVQLFCGCNNINGDIIKKYYKKILIDTDFDFSKLKYNIIEIMQN